MNYKNAFFISLIALAGSLSWGFSNNNKEELSPECSVEVEQMPPSEARGWINTYMDYLTAVNITDNNINTTAQASTVANTDAPLPRKKIGNGKYEIALDAIPEANRKIEYFKILHCEFSTILKELGPDADITAMLRVAPDENKAKPKQGALDLVFKVRPNSKVSWKLDDDGNSYFDFTTPCPPVCGGQ